MKIGFEITREDILSAKISNVNETHRHKRIPGSRHGHNNKESIFATAITSKDINESWRAVCIKNK